MTKRCTKCKENKSLECFYKNKARQDGLQNQCKSCTKNSNKKWVSENKEKNYLRCKKWYTENPDRFKKHQRKTFLKRKYNISLEKYEDMFAQQKGVCLICKKPETQRDSNGNIKKLSVDHCHTTGKIRGLLCNQHNKGLGHFQDSPELLELAANYLRQSYEV